MYCGYALHVTALMLARERRLRSHAAMQVHVHVVKARAHEHEHGRGLWMLREGSEGVTVGARRRTLATTC